MKLPSKIQKIQQTYYILAGVVLIGLVLRLWNISSPLLDWHSFRQVDTASVTREYIKNGVDLLRPKYHDLGDIQSGQFNVEGYRMVEFPFLSALYAVSYFLVSSILSLDTWLRFWSVIWSLGTIVSLYFLGKWLKNEQLGLTSAAVAAVLPYYVFYSRAVLPESALVFFLTASITLFAYWTESRKCWLYVASAISLALALLIKPFAAFFGLPFLVLIWLKWRWNAWKIWELYFFPIISFGPLLWWRSWIEQFPSGIPASDWLFNSNDIRFKPAWFRWLIWERLTKLWLGYVGVILLPLAVLKISYKELLVIGSWWIGAVVYVSVIATGNIQHDYYQVILTPLIVLTISRGILVGYELLSGLLKNKIGAATAVAGVLCIGLVFATNTVIPNYAINSPEFVAAGEAVDRLTPPNAKVIAHHQYGDTSLLYQTNRTGWSHDNHFEKKIELGAEYYITTTSQSELSEVEWIAESYTVIERTPDYILIDLTKPLTNPQLFKRPESK